MVAVHPSPSDLPPENDTHTETAKELTDNADGSTASDQSSIQRSPSSLSKNSPPSILTLDGLVVKFDDRSETTTVCCQSLLPFFVAGFGSIGAGLLLHWAQSLDLITGRGNKPALLQFLAVCPPLQGMKGNLDMTFTSRLSTMAHAGVLDEKKGRCTRILRNMALIQSQAIVISLFAVLISFLFDLTKRLPYNEPVPHQQFVFLGLSAVFAMMIACAITSSVMVLIVFFSRRCKIDPDNVATPIAASIGDIMAIGFMLGMTHMLQHFFYGTDLGEYMSGVVITLMVAAVLPIFISIASSDNGALLALKTQWLTLLVAAMLSSGAGYLQEYGVGKFRDFTAYQPLIAGIAGNRAALQASRISSHLNLHKESPYDRKTRLNPWKWYTGTDSESRTGRVLLFTSIPYQFVFVLCAHGLSFLLSEPLSTRGWFVFGYLCTAALQVSILLFLSQLVVYLLWKFGVDPDMHSIPLLTATGDLIGTSLLFGLFSLMQLITPSTIAGPIVRDLFNVTTTAPTTNATF